MFLQQLFNGIALGSTYALVAIGYSLVFGVLRIINFANGALYMLGAYLVFVLFSAMHGHLAAAIVLSLLATVYFCFARYRPWQIFLLAAPAELIVWLAFRVRRKPQNP